MQYRAQISYISFLPDGSNSWRICRPNRCATIVGAAQWEFAVTTQMMTPAIADAATDGLLAST
jgi:hypothetical protein